MAARGGCHCREDNCFGPPSHLGHFCKGSEYAPGVLYRGSPVAALKLPLTACCCELVGLLGRGGGVLLYDF